MLAIILMNLDIKNESFENYIFVFTFLYRYELKNRLESYICILLYKNIFYIST